MKSSSQHTSSGSTRELVKVVYSNKQIGKNEFFVFADALSLERWRKDHSGPIVDVVDSFQVLMAESGGNHGVIDHPSKQILSKYFGKDKKEVDMIREILLEGKVVRGQSHVDTNSKGYLD